MSEKQRGGATQGVTQNTSPFLSTNFILAVVLLFGGLFVGFPEGEARTLVAGLFTVIGSVGAFRVFLKNAEFSPRKWITNSNTWNYLSTIFIALFPVLTPEFFPAAKNVLDAALTGNFQGILTALISLGTILWNIYKTSQIPKAPAENA